MPGWQVVDIDATQCRVRVPPGVRLDLGATAKGLAADRAARSASRAGGGGVLVSLGGDIAVAGEPPADGWLVGVADSHRTAFDDADAAVVLWAGGLATSSVVVRTWRRGDAVVHHLVDPSTGACCGRSVAHRHGRCAELRRGERRLDRGDRPRRARRAWLIERRTPGPPGRPRRSRAAAQRLAGAGSVTALTSQVTWYVARGSGVVSLLLLTISLVLGIPTLLSWGTPRTPRLVVQLLHRNVSLLVVVFLALHVLASVVDDFVHITVADAFVPFVGSYRPFWLGLGAISMDLLLALIVTSLLRRHVGHRAWRFVHWGAYACWPIAVVHGLGIGSDERFRWMLAVVALCAAAVLAAVVWRVAATRRRGVLRMTGARP